MYNIYKLNFEISGGGIMAVTSSDIDMFKYGALAGLIVLLAAYFFDNRLSLLFFPTILVIGIGSYWATELRYRKRLQLPRKE